MNDGHMASNGRDRAARRFAASFAQPDLELAKWIAVITMAIDHYGKIVDESVFVETHAIGRLSFPLFAAIIAIRLAARPSLDQRYLRHLIPWTIVSQPIFVLVGRQWYDGNILVTLGLGVAATLVLQRRAELSTVSLAAALAAIAASSIFTDYGPLGVAMIPTMTFLARGGVHPAAAVSASACFSASSRWSWTN